MSAFNRRFSGGGVWFIQDKFASTGKLKITTGHTPGSYGKCRLQAEYKMHTEYKMRTRYKMQTADRVQNSDLRYKMQTASGKIKVEFIMYFKGHFATLT